MNTYSGIGSRQTPDDVLELMERIARKLAAEGWTLRSGHAEGADYAFEKGASGKAEIFLPWATFNSHLPVFGLRHDRPSRDAAAVARDLHPAWESLSDGGRILQARNAHQILGRELNDPVSFVICWTPDGATTETDRRTGGTGGAIRLAAYRGITVFNLQRADHRALASDFLNARWYDV